MLAAEGCSPSAICSRSVTLAARNVAQLRAVDAAFWERRLSLVTFKEVHVPPTRMASMTTNPPTLFLEMFLARDIIGRPSEVPVILLARFRPSEEVPGGVAGYRANQR